MDLFERGCPKTLTRGPSPKHHALAASMCLSSDFTALRMNSLRLEWDAWTEAVLCY